MTKTWDGILLELFNVGDRSIAYSWNPNLSVKVEAKEKLLGRVVFEVFLLMNHSYMMILLLEQLKTSWE